MRIIDINRRPEIEWQQEHKEAIERSRITLRDFVALLAISILFGIAVYVAAVS